MVSLIGEGLRHGGADAASAAACYENCFLRHGKLLVLFVVAEQKLRVEYLLRVTLLEHIEECLPDGQIVRGAANRKGCAAVCNKEEWNIAYAWSALDCSALLLFGR